MRRIFMRTDYYLYMKNLVDIIKEGLLDVEDNEKNMDTRILLQNHPDWRFSDGWTILDPPQERIGYGWDHKANLYIQDRSNGDVWSITDLKHNKFQALDTVTIEGKTDVNSVLKELNCAFCGWLDVRNAGNDIDFSKLKSPVNRVIRVVTETTIDVKPYKGHVNFVHLAKGRWCGADVMAWTPENVKDWDCNYLVVDASYFTVEGPLAHGDNKLNGFWIDRCQALIDNNPKAKEIYLYDRNLDVFFRLSTQGAKRKFKNTVNRKKVLNNIYDQEIRWCKYDVEGWKHDNIKLYDLSMYNEGILDVEDNEAGMDDMITHTNWWNNMLRKGPAGTDALNKLREIVINDKCKKITIPLSSQRGKSVTADPNKYYIYFVVNYTQDVTMIAMAYGDEKLYTINYPINKNGYATRFAVLTTGKIKKDLSHNGRGELYEAPDSLIWLYEKMKKESGY